jgi:hypothetical protein
MSNIGTSDIVNQTYSSVITTIDYNELKSMMDDNIKVDAKNAIIFSIPRENNTDIKGAGSIWLTDNDGNLYPLTKPIETV